MKYRITKQYPRDQERPCAQFHDINDAKFFIEERTKADSMLKIKVIYRLYQGVDDLIFEGDTSKPDAQSTGSDQTASAQGKERSASFRPTPFNMAPRPTGSPQKWIVNKDENKDEDENQGK